MIGIKIKWRNGLIDEKKKKRNFITVKSSDHIISIVSMKITFPNIADHSRDKWIVLKEPRVQCTEIPTY